MRVDAETIIAAVNMDWGAPCALCGTEITGYEVVLSWVAGFKTSLGCVECLATRLDRERREFLEHAVQSIRRLDCFRAGWNVSTRRLRDSGDWPHARVPEDIARRVDDDDESETQDASAESTTRTPDAVRAWDAGSMSCGDLVLELRLRLAALDAGQVLRVRATDPGAPGDLPAWCRLTRNPLVRAEHPHYWIQRRP